MSKQSIATGAGFDNHADSFYKGALYSGPFFLCVSWVGGCIYTLITPGLVHAQSVAVECIYRSVHLYST